MTYVIGYTHTLLPHHQETNADEQNIAIIEDEHHHHDHHQHTPEVDASEDHQHISHENHYDEGLLDLVVCLISEVEHPENDCNLEYYNLVKTKVVIQNKLLKARFVAVFIAVLNLSGQSESSSEYGAGNNLVYQPPLLLNTPNRGPPTIS